MNRQQTRRKLCEKAIESVNRANLHRVARNGVIVGWSGMKRQERRQLAKAYALGEWRKTR